MVEFDFVVSEMFMAVLARVIITPNDSHFYRKRDVTTPSSRHTRFSHRFSRKEYRANVPKNITFAVPKNFGHFLRVILWVKTLNLLRENYSTRVIERTSIVFKSIL